MTAGRPTKLTPSMSQTIIAFLKGGVSYTGCAKAVGIDEKSIYNWLQRGESDYNDCVDTEHSKFFLAFKEAEANLEYKLTTRLMDGETGWQGSAWLLERKPQFRKEYSVINPELEELKKELIDFKNEILKGKQNGN